jgi:hypothetical protein
MNWGARVSQKGLELMSLKRKARLSLFILLVLSFVWACSSQPKQYQIDQPSPDGSYRVKVNVKRGELLESLDEAQFQFLKGQEVIETWDWQQEDHFKIGFDAYLPLQWIHNQVLSIGAAENTVGYSDEVTVINDTGENVTHMSMNYGRTAGFRIFDVAPGKQITFQASPWFTPPGKDFNFGYSGFTQSGKRFEGRINGGERVHPGEQKKFSITISPEQLKLTASR